MAQLAYPKTLDGWKQTPNLETQLLLEYIEEQRRNSYMFVGAHPQYLIPEGHAEKLLAINRLSWDDLWEHRTDLRFTRETELVGYDEVSAMMRTLQPVKIWTQQSQGLPVPDSVLRRYRQGWDYLTPVLKHPTFGPLCDMDILIRIQGGVLIKRQPFANDQIGANHDVGWYVWNGTP